MTATGPRVVFRFAVSITAAIDTAYQTAADVASPENAREMARELFRDLKRAGYVDADCELLDYEVKDAAEEWTP